MDVAVRATLRGWKLLYIDDLKVIEDSLSFLGLYAVCLIFLTVLSVGEK